MGVGKNLKGCISSSVAYLYTKKGRAEVFKLAYPVKIGKGSMGWGHFRSYSVKNLSKRGHFVSGLFVPARLIA